MLPRWIALVLVGVILILAALFFAPLVPVAGTFLYWVLLLVGLVFLVYGLYVLLAGYTRA